MVETARISLQAPPALTAAFGEAFGIPLPEALLTARSGMARAALRLGPDEWLLLAEDAPARVLIAALEAARAGAAASIVDVSDRQVALDIEGPEALDLLAEGCPLDLAAMPEGGCTRTLFGKAEVILWRRAEDWFRLEVARSFAPYVRALLAEAAGDQDRDGG
ncbi:sarcosine oxidase subunit gamma [Paeniroseomonas aquatica]|uniref:Sarcosine oxidase subunit gamma family protein n=1 Tax=Paeniroseomonas aquatica TaxID=373043 RepID=A0ABT8A5N1_9PROT|nr:sarcosine oxidase subunit gamma family protein [Paeniroseomonas aquatica]MDN3564965.1 sarcosine oxidase subunit gamma family protein [Paeniroseomonas aquatica]